MITKMQMCFSTLGSALNVLKRWSRAVSANAATQYHLIQIDRKPGWGSAYHKSFERRAVVINTSRVDTDPVLSGLGSIKVWISEKDFYFFEMDFVSAEEDIVKRSQFHFLSNIILGARGDRFPIKLFIGEDGITTTVRVAISIITLSRCRNGRIARMIFDMASEDEVG